MTTLTRALRVRPNGDGTFTLRRPDGATRRLASMSEVNLAARPLVAAMDTAPVENRTPFFAIMALIGVETDEGGSYTRMIDAVEPRGEFPLPLWSLVSSNHGEGEFALVGRFDEFRVEGLAVLSTGSFDNTLEATATALQGLENGADGLSIDPSYPEPPTYECTEWDPDDPGWCVRERQRVPVAAIGGATLVGMPAFTAARIALDAYPPVNAEPAPPAVEAPPCEDCEDDTVIIVASVRALTAALALPTYPAEAFRPPEGLTGDHPLTVTTDGHIYGAYPTGMCHRGLPGDCQTAPPDPDFAEFLLTPVTLDDGSRVMAGPLTFRGSAHVANPSLNIAAVRAAYDNTASVAGLVTMGHGDGFDWYAGVLRPDLSEDELWEVAACAQVSGHWQPVGGASRLAALHVVPTPGFPARALAASGASLIPGPSPVPFLVRQYETLARQVADLAPLRELLPLAADTVVASLPPGPPKVDVAAAVRRDLAAARGA